MYTPGDVLHTHNRRHRQHCGLFMQQSATWQGQGQTGASLGEGHTLHVEHGQQVSEEQILNSASYKHTQQYIVRRLVLT